MQRYYKLNIHIHFTTSATVFAGYSPRSGPGTARYLIHVQPVFCELSLIAFPLLLLQPPSLVEVVRI